jgi:hypothetical protein
MIFTPAKRRGGGAIEANEYYIDTAAAVVKGSPVVFTVGAGITAYDATDADDPIWGIAAEDHDGSTAGRESGYKILIWDDPDIVFKCIPATLSTVDSGDSTSWVDAEFTGADDLFNGGHIVVVSTNSVSGFNVGDVLAITDFANSGGDFTVTGAGGTIAAGITGYVYPGPKAGNCIAFDAIATTFNNLNMKSAGGETFKIVNVEWDPAKKRATIYFMIRLHQQSTHYTAL